MHQEGHDHAVDVAGVRGEGRVEVGVGVDPEDGYVGMYLGVAVDRPDGHGVVAAQRQARVS